MSAAPLPGTVAVARRRALIAEAGLVHLAYANADVAALTAARAVADKRIAELADLELAADAAGPPDRRVLTGRLEFARERVVALATPAGRPAHPVLLARIQLAVADATHHLIVFLVSAGAPVDLGGLDVEQAAVSEMIAAGLWDEAVAAAGGSDE